MSSSVASRHPTSQAAEIRCVSLPFCAFMQERVRVCVRECVCESVCVCVCERERERCVCVHVRERESVSVRERECACVCVCVLCCVFVCVILNKWLLFAGCTSWCIRQVTDLAHKLLLLGVHL